MKHGQLTFLAFLTITSLFDCRPSLSATSAVDLAAAEAAVRTTDAVWAATAGTANVDAWMAFYAADAIGLLPDDQLTSGKEHLRQPVSRLLAQPHLSVAWRPIKVAVAPSGDLAFMIGAYELRFSDSRGAPVSERGRRVELWRKQADGAWKCIVDTWNLDEPITAQAAAQTAPPQTAPPQSAPPQSAPPQSAPPQATPPQATPPQATPARGAATKYGDMPTDYQEAIRKYFLEHLKYPESVQIREITTPEQGYTTAVVGTFLMSEKRQYGWKVKATINAKNSDDRYVGFRTYTFLFRAEKIVDTRVPLPGGEMN